MSSSSKRKRGEKCGREGSLAQEAGSDFFKRERVVILSKIVGDPTVGGFRDKKESCSTQKGLRVGTRFKEFRKTP